MSVNIGVIGTGRFGVVHCRTFRQMQWDGQATLAAICRRDPDSLKQQAAVFNAEPYTDYRALLDHPGLDAVSICTPDHKHCDIALEAIGRGLHVLAEKPLDTSVEGCRRIVEAARAKGVLLQVDLHKRFDPDHRAAEQAIRLGRMGQILYGYAWMEDRIEVPTEWLPRWAGASSPAWFLGVHLYDLARWLLHSDVSEVYARGQREKLYRELQIDAYDSVSAHVTFANGAQFAFQTSWVLPKRFEAVVNQGIRIVGTEGMWELDSHSRGSRSCMESQGMETWNLSASQEYEDAAGRTRIAGYVMESIRSFARNVSFLKEGGTLAELDGRYPSGEDGLQATRIADAVHRSINSGDVIRL